MGGCKRTEQKRRIGCTPTGSKRISEHWKLLQQHRQAHSSLRTLRFGSENDRPYENIDQPVLEKQCYGKWPDRIGTINRRRNNGHYLCHPASRCHFLQCHKPVSRPNLSFPSHHPKSRIGCFDSLGNSKNRYGRRASNTPPEPYSLSCRKRGIPLLYLSRFFMGKRNRPMGGRCLLQSLLWRWCSQLDRSGQ